MLRRDFIKTTALTAGGIVVLGTILPEPAGAAEKSVRPYIKRDYRLVGHARSGCATPPELTPFLENGGSMMPLE
ncbi:MAG: twin-arginine translocation signal domain-containing protein [Candidatus Zixiibacteriota bacterium]|nr:MAG: twin-arginine translocation signal domain-containing protein [candidate division Zixibacteria bacterium]